MLAKNLIAFVYTNPYFCTFMNFSRLFRSLAPIFALMIKRYPHRAQCQCFQAVAEVFNSSLKGLGLSEEDTTSIIHPTHPT